MRLVWDLNAWEDYLWWQAQDRRVLKRINQLIQDILRKRSGYDGAIFCDDLSMHGAAVVGSMEDRARIALEAGCDMLPVCNDRASVLGLLDSLKDLKPQKASSDRLKKLYRKEV